MFNNFKLPAIHGDDDSDPSNVNIENLHVNPATA